MRTRDPSATLAVPNARLGEARRPAAWEAVAGECAEARLAPAAVVAEGRGALQVAVARLAAEMARQPAEPVAVRVAEDEWMRTDSLRNRGSRRFFGALLAVGTFGLRWRNIASAIGANPAKHFLSTLYTNAAANRCITKVLVALYFFTAGPSNSGRVAVFPGAWNPPTRAHLEIARVARNHIGEVIWVLPRIFPTKASQARAWRRVAGCSKSW